MSTTFPYNSPYDLTEFSMIGGTNQELVFAVYDEDGNALSLAGATITWYLTTYGYSVSEVSKTAVSGSATNVFVVYLDDSDTASLSGKYVQQYKIVDTSGSVFRPSQGLINIFPASS
jgi:hypothetical protein